MSQLRCSRRVRGLPPEIQGTTYRCFCLLNGDACLGGAVRLNCCKQFLHLSCFQRWKRNHDTCPLCRQNNVEEESEEEDPMQEEGAAVNPIVPPNLENLTNDEVIARLERLLDVNQLRREMQQVSDFFIPRQELGMELSILKLYRLYIEGEISLVYFVEVDVDHVTLTFDEKRTPFNLIKTAARRHNPNILHLCLRRLNFVNEHRTHIRPMQYLDRHIVYVDQMILLDLHLVRVQRQDSGEKINFSIRFHRYRPHFN